MYQNEKHPNANVLMGNAVQQETRDFKTQGQQDVNAFQSFTGQGERKAVLPPQGEAQQKASTQTRVDPVIMQKVQKARSLNIPDDKIRKALIEEGKNPADYGFAP